MERKAHLTARVYGRVQGVGFRFYVYHIATALNLQGYVKNLANSDIVEVCAEGQRVNLETLIAKLKEGPPAARIVNLEVKLSDALSDYRGFHITYD